MKFKLFAVLPILFSFIFTSCDEPMTSNPLVSTTIPKIGWTGNRYDGDLFYKPYSSGDENGYFAFQISGSKVKKCVYNYVTDSKKDAQRIAESLRSGTWLSEDEPCKLPINNSGKVVYLNFSLLDGASSLSSTASGPNLEWIMNIWENKWKNPFMTSGYLLPNSLYFGAIKNIGDEYEYTTTNVFGTDISATITSEIESTKDKIIYTFTAKLKTPSNALASFVAKLIPIFTEADDIHTTAKVNGTDAILISKSEFGPYDQYRSVGREVFLYNMDIVLHKPLQCILLEYGYFDE